MGRRQSPPYDSVDPPPLLAEHWLGPAVQFSPDGRHWVYEARREGESFVVHDGDELEGYAWVQWPTLSPDGSRLAYWAEMGSGRWAVVVDGRIGPEWGDFGVGPIFSPDGRRIAYVGCDSQRDGGASRLVVGDHVGPSHNDIFHLTFTADSRHVVYVAQEGELEDEQESVVVDDRLGPPFDQVLLGDRWREPWPQTPEGHVEYLAIRDDVVYRIRQHVPAD